MQNRIAIILLADHRALPNPDSQVLRSRFVQRLHTLINEKVEK